ncbi:hypothetical protein PRK78_006033 [Emydomyces testavorans]|uniref:Chitin-binding type-1 domain-containing protein n=1 Tax=Emydomyces testavorans TaxID=2070801 RepID=A0AAF0DNC3_9EURO|nr:hypothetical protein PRK78_006033 [Emydomyces testavorans]
MRAQWVKLGLSLVFATLTAASFNIYATYDHHAIAAALGISSQCLSALYVPVLLFTLGECSKSLTSWLSAVEKKCARDQVTANGIIFEPKAFPLKYIAGHDIACLRDASEAFCILESQKWDDSVYTNKKIQYCSECFLLLWRQRLLSPTLPPGNFTDYLIDQFKVLEETCSTDLPFTTSAPTLIIGAAPTKAANVRRWAATHIPVASPTPSSLIARKSIAPRKAFYRTGRNADKQLFSGIEIDDLMSYNTQLDRDCANLWHNYAICIAPAHIQSSTETAVPTEPGKKNMPEDWDDDDGSNDSDDLPQDDDMPEWLKNISKDGKCDEDTSCVGSGFGDCCSSSGYCGSGPMWCGEDKDGEDYDEDAYGDKKQSGKHRKDDKDGKGGKRRKRRRA